MDIKDIQDLIKLVNRSTLTEVEIEEGEFRMKIRRKAAESKVVYAAPQPQVAVPVPAQVAAPAAPASPAPAAPEAAAPAPAPAEDTSNLTEFKSPMIGTFYRASSPESEVFSKVGDVVSKGQVLCIIEAMKLFNEIESEVEGKIVKILVDDAQPVEYDQPLFLIDTSASA